MNAAFSDLVKDGGISAPAWAFFTTILLGVGGLFREQIKTRRKVDNATTAIGDASSAANDAADSAKAAAENTHTVGNGFVARQDANFTALFGLVSRIDGKFDMLDQRLDSHIETFEKVIKLNNLKKEDPT
jgi:hypothetical protein